MPIKWDEVKCEVIPGGMIACCDLEKCIKVETLQLKNISLDTKKKVIQGVPDSGENHACKIVDGRKLIECISEWGEGRKAIGDRIHLPGWAWIGK